MEPALISVKYFDADKRTYIQDILGTGSLLLLDTLGRF